MDRRRFLLTSVAGAFAAPLAAGAQETGKVYRPGYVAPAPGPTPVSVAFDRALHDAGLVEGKSIIVDRQFMGAVKANTPPFWLNWSGRCRSSS
jgi:hypothetical protein